MIFTACGEEKTASERADELCARLMTMDTHNHVDIPMKTGEVPGPRVNLRDAMQKAGISAIGMTFAVDYVQPLAEGQEYERFLNGITAQDSVGIDHVCIGTDSKITPEYSEFNPEMMKRMRRDDEKKRKQARIQGRRRAEVPAKRS